MLGIKRLEALQGHRRAMAQGAPTTGLDSPYRGPRSGVFTIMPHNVTMEERRRPAFWNPGAFFKRMEFLVSPPDLPGTAIPFTLFHPTYIPGLQGWRDTLPTNFGWIWGRNNFERFGSYAYRIEHPAGSAQSVTQRTGNWKPQMNAPFFGNARVWDQPRPSYVPIIINPPAGGGGGGRVRGRRGV